MTYIGEQLWPGWIGQGLIWLAFITSTVAAILYYFTANEKNPLSVLKRRKIARWLFYTCTTAIILALVILYYLILNHRFEYSYVWQYSSKDMPIAYIWSCFWAGQEGSFLIWAFWQAIVGIVLLRTAKRWENSVMTVYSAIQALSVSTLLGIHYGWLQIGKSPFTLLRNVMGVNEPEFFRQSDYLSNITDGNGLNPLLENIWMTIHPPTLFLGYALIAVPFAFAIAGLWQKRYDDWTHRARPWTLASMLVLGTGILLGGLWAYVSLTFGGFWAWDPVENASLIPWIILAAALHFQIMVIRKQRTGLWAFLLTVAALFFVQYASYLTKSGVLAQTSAHAFTGNSMVGHMVVIMLVILVVPLVLLWIHRKAFTKEHEGQPAQRDFWMMIGSIVLLLAAFQIFIVTSVPVWNKLFGLTFAPPVDVVAFYNKWQTFYAIGILILIAISTYMSYKKSQLTTFYRKSAFAAGSALVVTIVLSLFAPITQPQLVLLTFAALYALIVSTDVFIKLARLKINTGAMLAHLGLATFIIGIVITFSNTETISHNTSGIALQDEQMNKENAMLIKGDTVIMAHWRVVYNHAEVKGKETFYHIDFLSGEGKPEKEFTVTPSVNRNTRMGYVFNPSTHRGLFKDIFTYLTYAEENAGQMQEIMAGEAGMGDTLVFENKALTITDLAIENESKENGNFENLKIIATVDYIESDTLKGKPVLKETLKVTYQVKGREATSEPVLTADGKKAVIFDAVSEQPGKIKLNLVEVTPDFIVLKVNVNPWINLVWIGALLLFAGLITAMIHRPSRKKRQNSHITHK